MLYVCDVLHVVLNVCVSCFVVHGCSVSMRNIYVFNCDMCTLTI